MTFREIVGIELAPLCSRELVFAHDAFMAVELALYSVLENAGGFGQQANDLEAAPDLDALVPIGREADRLSNGKLVCYHVLLSRAGAQSGKSARAIGAAVKSRLGRAVIDACGEALVFERYLSQMLPTLEPSWPHQWLKAGRLRRSLLLSYPFCLRKKGSRADRAPPCPLGLPQIDRGGFALIAALEIEAHSLAFVQIADAGAFYRRDVYEDILRARLPVE